MCRSELPSTIGVLHVTRAKDAEYRPRRMGAGTANGEWRTPGLGKFEPREPIGASGQLDQQLARHGVSRPGLLGNTAHLVSPAEGELSFIPSSCPSSPTTDLVNRLSWIGDFPCTSVSSRLRTETVNGFAPNPYESALSGHLA